MNHHHSHSRRSFLRGAGLTAAAGFGASPFLHALAATGADATDDYKALVCIYLVGGNDSYNTVLATDSASWSAYQSARNGGVSPIALAAPGTSKLRNAPACSPAALGGVLPISPISGAADRTFALHPLLKNAQGLFNSGKLGVVANVGTLVRPLTINEYQAGTAPTPPKLFSHNDQQSVWQSSLAEGARNGWGGSLADFFAAGNGTGANFTAVSPAGQSLWLSGRTVLPFQMSVDGPVRLNATGASTLYNSSNAWSTIRKVMAGTSPDLFQQEYASLAQRALDRSDQLQAALPSATASGIAAPGTYLSPTYGTAAINPLAQQLQAVARMIAARSTLGVKRQVFYVSLGGFDTHNNQNIDHAELMARLDHALGYFNNALATLPGGDASGMVAAFTMSEFGRALVSNGAGCDHGWGGHHFIMGGPVKGGSIYGTFPTVGLKHDQDVGNGRLLPSLGVDQYAATLGAWFGASPSQLGKVFPNLQNFGSAQNLGFMNV